MNVQIPIAESLILRGIFNSGLGTYYHSVVSITGYNADLKLDLRPEPTNTHDANAVQITYMDIPIGYLVREDAMQYHKYIYALKYLEHIDRIKIVLKMVDCIKIKKMPDGRAYREVELIVTKRR